MKLRKKPKYEIESYKKMFDLRVESIDVLSVLRVMWMREDLKKKLQDADNAIFET